MIMAASMASESVFDLKAYAGSRRALVESKLEEYLRGGEPRCSLNQCVIPCFRQVSV